MLRESKGNMYDFITHTWNSIKGECPHGCTYCYMKRWKQKPPRLDESELKTDLGSNNYIFVGSGIDMFAREIPMEWTTKPLFHCCQFNNRYLLHTKNPYGLNKYLNVFPFRMTVCVTIESDKLYDHIMMNVPTPTERALVFSKQKFDKMVTIEPILDFNENNFLDIILEIQPFQVNIGADSGNNKLPEPSWLKVVNLIDGLENAGIIVHQKKNLNRLKKGV